MFLLTNVRQNEFSLTFFVADCLLILLRPALGVKWAIFDCSILEERAYSIWADFWHGIASYFQLRVVRAFKSTLEDLEERLSVHSANSGRAVLRGGRIPSDITYIDAEDPPQLHLQQGVKSRFLGPPRRAPRAETPI